MAHFQCISFSFFLFCFINIWKQRQRSQMEIGKWFFGVCLNTIRFYKVRRRPQVCENLIQLVFVLITDN